MILIGSRRKLQIITPYPSADIPSLHAKTQIYPEKDYPTVFSAKSYVTRVLVGKVCRAHKAVETFHRFTSHRLSFTLLLRHHETCDLEPTRRSLRKVQMLSPGNLIKG